jgi:LacI family transcriptional regulator
VSVTIKEVAQAAGVSPKTVSRVLNGEAYVRPAVKDAILEVIERLGYKPNMAARSLASARSYLIGLAIDDPTWSAYAAGIQMGALKRCRDRGYHLVVEPVDTNRPESEEALLRGLAHLRLDGLIIVPPLCTWASLLDRIEAIDVPYVRIAPGEHPARSALVEIDERQASYDLTEHLIRLGHRDIGFIQGIEDHAATPRRRAGFLAAMHEAGLPVKPGRIQPGAFTFHSGLQGGEALLGDPADRPTAIFASNDDTAMGVMAAANRLNIAVPQALSVVGFDDAPTARIAWPPITTVHQPLADMAAAAVDILVDPKYRSHPDDAAFRRQLPYRIVERGSVGPAPA